MFLNCIADYVDVQITDECQVINQCLCFKEGQRVLSIELKKLDSRESTLRYT